MIKQATEETLSLGILPESPYSALVEVRDLVQIFNSLQQSIYTTALIEGNKVRLTPAQIKRYSLSIKSIRSGSIWADLVPSAVRHAPVYNPLLPDILNGIYVNIIWSLIGKSVIALKDVFTGTKKDDQSSIAYLKSCIPLARLALEKGQQVRIVYRKSNGDETIFETTREASNSVLQRATRLYGEIREYKNVVVRNILTSTPAISVKSPEYPRRLLRCEYDKSQEQDVVDNIKPYQLITVIGRPEYNANEEFGAFPKRVRIDLILDEHGNPIVHQPSLGFD